MTAAPPHSIGRSRDPIEREAYDERNSVLYLLLGLISLSERVLSVVPELVGEAPPAQALDGRPHGAPAMSEAPDGGGLLR